MKILLTGATGGIGSAIKETLKGHELFDAPDDDLDWLIFAHGMIDERNPAQVFRVNTAQCILFTQVALPTLKQGVIYISSSAALTANSRFPIYSASKAALNTYSVAMSKVHPELQFYAICPGPTNTKMWRSLGLPGKAQEPSEVAKVVKMCMEGHFTSGAIISVRDGIYESH